MEQKYDTTGKDSEATGIMRVGFVRKIPMKNEEKKIGSN
jgi:hypothetical protein